MKKSKTKIIMMKVTESLFDELTYAPASIIVIEENLIKDEQWEVIGKCAKKLYDAKKYKNEK